MRQQPLRLNHLNPLDVATPALPAQPTASDLYELLAVVIGVCENLAEALADSPSHSDLAKVGLLAANRAADLAAKLRASPANADHGDDLISQANLLAPHPAVGPSVLLVEDDPELLAMLTAAFVREGFRTHTARNGRLGVRMLGALKPDLMVTDIVMPEMEGIGTILEARRQTPDTKVIAISGGGQYGRSANFLEWASELGADEVLAKPFRVSSLITAARVVLDRPAPRPDHDDEPDHPQLRIVAAR